MFTGLIEEVGALGRITPLANGRRLFVSCRAVREGMGAGDSLAVNGVCQTVTQVAADGVWFEAVGDTLAKTTLGDLTPGEPVNLERACRADSRLGGHFVLGHVEAVERILDWSPRGDAWNLEISLAPHFRRYVIAEGSVAIDGVSLTVAELTDRGFRISVIPHTRATTRLAFVKAGAAINLEVDILAKYVESMLAPAARGLDTDMLKKWGYV
jgi:riboflavin synthase